MILAAAVLVLVGLALFVGGVLTDVTLLYWLCVAACVLAGVFLVLARVRMGGAPAAPASRPAAAGRATPPTTGERRAAEGSTPATAAGAATAPAEAPTTDTSAPAASAADAPAPPGEHTSTGSRPVVEPAAPSVVEPAHHGHVGTGTGADGAGDPPVEEVEVTDLLLVVDLRDDVLVVDEHPRYHLPGCRWLSGRETIPLPLDEARTDGFTPCGWCEPDRTLAERERARRTGRTP